MRVWDNAIGSFVDVETGELFDHPEQFGEPMETYAPAPVPVTIVRHTCGCPRKLRFAPESPAGREFVKMVKGSVCRECQRAERARRLGRVVA